VGNRDAAGRETKRVSSGMTGSTLWHEPRATKRETWHFLET
jgi:hypothetical protein